MMLKHFRDLNLKLNCQWQLQLKPDNLSALLVSLQVGMMPECNLRLKHQAQVFQPEIPLACLSLSVGIITRS
jgi:hypothetical protein